MDLWFNATACETNRPHADFDPPKRRLALKVVHNLFAKILELPSEQYYSFCNSPVSAANLASRSVLLSKLEINSTCFGQGWTIRAPEAHCNVVWLKKNNGFTILSSRFLFFTFAPMLPANEANIGSKVGVPRFVFLPNSRLLCSAALIHTTIPCRMFLWA